MERRVPVRGPARAPRRARRAGLSSADLGSGRPAPRPPPVLTRGTGFGRFRPSPLGGPCGFGGRGAYGLCAQEGVQGRVGVPGHDCVPSGPLLVLARPSGRAWSGRTGPGGSWPRGVRAPLSAAQDHRAAGRNPRDEAGRRQCARHGGPRRPRPRGRRQPGPLPGRRPRSRLGAVVLALATGLRGERGGRRHGRRGRGHGQGGGEHRDQDERHPEPCPKPRREARHGRNGAAHSGHFPGWGEL